MSAARLLRCATWANDERVHVTVPYSVARASHARDVMPHSFLGANLQGIRDAAERTEAARGLRRLEDLLGLLDPRSESPGESRTRLALVAAGLPAPRLQFEIPTAEGVFRADFAWPELMVILEFDGESKYFDYRPTPDVLLAERRRENALVVEGWTLVRARWADLSNPGVVPARVLAAFERARRLAGWGRST
jgi:very-short-patch-repair endonuclease